MINLCSDFYCVLVGFKLNLSKRNIAMKVIITGATGMLGKGVLLECLEHKDISEILSISRVTTGLEHPKLKELLHKDFLEFSSLNKELAGYDACYACMGVSAGEVSEEQYFKLTYDSTMALAKELYGSNPEMTFVYISGQGTDSSEKGKTRWARVKGKTENDLLSIGFRKAYMFRPGGIIPKKGIKPSSKLYRRLIFWLGWMLWLMKLLAPKSIVDTSQIGLAMINIAKKGYDKDIINPADIQILAQ